MDATEGGQHKDVAVFIDWENLKYGLLNRENRLPNAQAVKEAATRFGRVVTAKAYANWQEGHNLRDPNDLYSVGIEPIYVPTIFTGADGLPGEGQLRRKNSVDIKLAVDAVELALGNPAIETFVFVTGDGDFIHLVNTLRMRGKRVVIIGASWNTSWQLTSTADQFIAYDVEVDPSTRTNVAPKRVSQEEAFDALVEVVKQVREKGRPNVFAQIKLLLTSRLGSFDEQRLGFSKFKDFMREAERRGLVKTQTVGLTDRVYLPHEEIQGGLAAESVEHVEDSSTPVELSGADVSSLAGLVRFMAVLEQASPFVSFNYIVNHALEAGIIAEGPEAASQLVDQAIREGLFMTDSRTILDRVTGEYRDMNVFRLNRQHLAVVEALTEEAPEAPPAPAAATPAPAPARRRRRTPTRTRAKAAAAPPDEEPATSG